MSRIGHDSNGQGAGRDVSSAAWARPAFTLIELLVVISIMTLLMSILTPSLSRARQQAKGTVCLTRLSEFMKALTAYGNESAGVLPPIVYPVAGHEPVVYHGWSEALYMFLYRDKDFQMDEDFPVQRNRDGRFALWVCKEAFPIENSTGHYRAYEINWLSGTLDRANPRLPLLCDANPAVAVPEDLRLSYVPREHIAGLEGEAYIDERHYGGANYSFNDGHVVRDATLKERLAEDWDLNPSTPNL